MYEIEHNIFVDSYCLCHEYELVYGDKKDKQVIFQFYNSKRDKEGKKLSLTYTEALNLARNKARDLRSKNYHFLIYQA